MWIEAIVLPREGFPPLRPLSSRRRGSRATASSPAPDRAHLQKAGCEEGRRFRDTVLGFLRARHLMSAVRWISDPGAHAQVTLHCTQGVLEQLRQAPEFDTGVSMHLELHT